MKQKRLKVEFVSRGDFKRLCAKTHELQEDWVAISISDTKREHLEASEWVKNKFSDSILLVFSDDDTGIDDKDLDELFSFINKNPNKNVLVHCFAGVSRSGAVAKFVNEYYDYGNWYLEDYMGYNKKVYDQLLAKAGLSISAYYSEIEKKDRSTDIE